MTLCGKLSKICFLLKSLSQKVINDFFAENYARLVFIFQTLKPTTMSIMFFYSSCIEIEGLKALETGAEIINGTFRKSQRHLTLYSFDIFLYKIESRKSSDSKKDRFLLNCFVNYSWLLSGSKHSY